MSRTLVGAIAILALGLFSHSAHAADTDPWWGPDKALHFGISAAIGAGGYGVSALVLERPWQRAAAGGSVALAVGAGKELYDSTGHGDPSWKDFTWDTLGAAFGVSLSLLMDWALRGRSAQRPPGERAFLQQGAAWR